MIPKQKNRLHEALNGDENLSAKPTTTKSHTKSDGPVGGDQSQTPVVLTNEVFEVVVIMREVSQNPTLSFYLLLLEISCSTTP